MGDLNRGYTFVAAEVVTPSKLHQLVDSAELKAASVGTTELADGAVTAAKLSSGISVTASQITLANGKVLVGNASNVGTEVTVDTATINTSGSFGVKDSGIVAAKLATDAVETAKIKDANVTLPKLAAQAASTLLGNPTGSSAVPIAFPLSTGLEFSGGALRVTTAISGGTITKGSVSTTTLSTGVTGILYSGAHSLGAAPFEVSLKLKCLTAEVGYTVGQYLDASLAFYDGGDYDIKAFWWTADATNYKVGRLPAVSGSTVLSIPHGSTGALTGITESSWAIEATPWR